MKKNTSYLPYILTLAVFMAAVHSSSAKGNSSNQTAYLFGLSASFNDSTVYITDIQEVSPVMYAPKTRFLMNREGYSSQLKGYIQGLGIEHPTCITFYSPNYKKITKQLEKIKNKYAPKPSKKKHKKKNAPRYEVHYLSGEQFSYQVIAPDEGTVYVDPTQAEQAARKSAKKEEKDRKKK